MRTNYSRQIVELNPSATTQYLEVEGTRKQFELVEKFEIFVFEDIWTNVSEIKNKKLIINLYPNSLISHKIIVAHNKQPNVKLLL